MALQGDLQSFALPDVLRLLVGTAKSGLLEVHGPGTTGELGLRGGGIVHGELVGPHRAAEPGEVLFELLRLDEGSFAFTEGEQPGDQPTTDIEFALERAETLVREWAEVEAIVPSMESWVALAGEGRADGLALTALQWRTVVAIGGGGNVRDLAATLGLGDLEACRAVASLAESDLVDIRLSHTTVSTPVREHEGFEPGGFELDTYDHLEMDADLHGSSDHGSMGMTELEDLVVEDRPVVMEESEDALLPEPLPGEGIAYDGESITGSVDGRTFDVPEAAIAPDSAYDAFEQVQAAPAPEPQVAPDHVASFGMAGDADPFPLTEAAAAFDSATSADVDAAALDDERGSLLKFLSTVKP